MTEKYIKTVQADSAFFLITLSVSGLAYEYEYHFFVSGHCVNVQGIISLENHQKLETFS